MKLHPAIALLITCTGLIACAPSPAVPTPTATIQPTPTVTAQPTSTESPAADLTPAPTPTLDLPVVMFEPAPETLRLDGLIRSPNVLARVGLGYLEIREEDLETRLDGSDILLDTSTGFYRVNIDTLEQVWALNRNGHPDYSPDRQRFMLNERFDDDAPVIYDAGTGRLIAELPGLWDGLWSPDGSLVAVEQWGDVEVIDNEPYLRSDYTYRIFDGVTGAPIATVSAPGSELVIPLVGGLNAPVWSPDSRFFSACSEWGDVYIWNLASGRVPLQLDFQADLGVSGCGRIFSPDSHLVAVYGQSELVIIDSANGDEVFRYSDGLLLDWLPDLGLVIDADDSLIVIDPTTGETVRSISVNFERVYQWLDGDWAFILPPASSDISTYRHVNLRSGQEEILPLGTGSIWSFNSQRWSLELATERNSIIGDSERNPLYRIVGADVWPQWLAENTLLYDSGEHLHYFNVETRQVEATFRYRIDPQRIAWSADSQTAILTDKQGQAWYLTAPDWQIGKTAPQSMVTGPEIAADLAEIPDDSSYGAAPDGEYPSPDITVTARVANQTGCGDGYFGGGCGAITGRLQIIRNGQVIYDDGPPGEYYNFPGEGIGALAWSANSRVLAVGGAAPGSDLEGFAIRLFDTVSGQMFKRLEEHRDAVRYLLFSPDGSKLISVSNDGTIIIWDLTR